MSLQTQIFASINATEGKTANQGSATATQSVSRSFLLGSGTSAGAADTVFIDKRSVAPGGSDNLTLTGVLKDVLGNAVNLAKVKAILITADAANGGKITLGGAATHPFLGPLGGTTPTHDIDPGGIYMAADPNTGWLVAAGSADTLAVSNPGTTSATYEIAIIGSSS